MATAAEPTARDLTAAAAPPDRAAEAAGAAAFRAATPAGSWRVRDGRLERSADGGRTWTRVEIPTTDAFASVTVKTPDTVVATTVSGRP